MRHITKEELDKLVHLHNKEDDQVWARTLKTCVRRWNGISNREVIGLCNYGNLYLCIVSPEGYATRHWIRKSDLGIKYRDLSLELCTVRDNILDKFREEHDTGRLRTEHRILN